MDPAYNIDFELYFSQEHVPVSEKEDIISNLAELNSSIHALSHNDFDYSQDN